MREMGLQGAVRGRRFKTTKPDSSGARPMDLVERDFNATRPNELWVSDLTYVATWRGFVYVAFVIDVFARLIVGWRATTSLTAGIALDALEQALHERRLNPEDPLVHHIRDELLSVAGRLARDGETQLKQSPENPGRFKQGKHQNLTVPKNGMNASFDTAKSMKIGEVFRYS